MGPDNFFADGEAEACSPGLPAFDLDKFLKNPALIFRRNPWAVILDGQVNMRVDSLGPEPDMAALFHIS